MYLRIIGLCAAFLVLVTGCGANQQKQANGIKQPENQVQEPKQPVVNKDEEIIKRFTFAGTPKTGKKILDGKIKDGVYESDTPATQYGHKGYFKLTVKNGQVIEVVFYQKDPNTGSFKDENYGKEYGTKFGEDTFQKAQKSVEGGKKYPVALIEKQDLNEIDAVSGATFNLSIFKDGVNRALEKGMK